MSEIDETARRLLSLAVEFSNASHPLSTDAIHQAFYAGLSRKTFYTQFRRDRERLVPCGLVIREAGAELWEADRSSFATDIDADPDDLLALDLVCLQLASDVDYPYRHDLLRALAKMERSYARSEALESAVMPAEQGRRVRTLLEAHAARHLVWVRYVDAAGASTERTLAIYGEFGLRGHVYFIGVDVSGKPEERQEKPVEPHVFRDDRFRKVRELDDTYYNIPEDFCVDDWRRLPFQVGTQRFEAELAVPTDVEPTVREALIRAGRLMQTADGREVWRVWASSEIALASWAIANALTPLSPVAVVDSWENLLKGALV